MIVVILIDVDALLVAYTEDEVNGKRARVRMYRAGKYVLEICTSCCCLNVSHFYRTKRIMQSKGAEPVLVKAPSYVNGSLRENVQLHQTRPWCADRKF